MMLQLDSVMSGVARTNPTRNVPHRMLVMSGR
jgi:hypothetical protein